MSRCGQFRGPKEHLAKGASISPAEDGARPLPLCVSNHHGVSLACQGFPDPGGLLPPSAPPDLRCLLIHVSYFLKWIPLSLRKLVTVS